jgi:transcriptional regulator with XRE-family HTH domain
MPRQTPRRTVEIHGYALRVIREARGRSVADLAAKLPGRNPDKGCDRSYITHIENGTKTEVSAEFYNALIAELHLDDYRVLLANPHVATAVPA